MGSKLYVGNLSYNVTNSDLEQLCSPHGTVQSADVIQDRDTGRSKGFGFVQMGSEGEAQAAISALNGQDHDGRSLTVNEAKPREERPRSGGGGGGGYGGGNGNRYKAARAWRASKVSGRRLHALRPPPAFSTPVPVRCPQRTGSDLALTF